MVWSLKPINPINKILGKGLVQPKLKLKKGARIRKDKRSKNWIFWGPGGIVEYPCDRCSTESKPVTHKYSDDMTLFFDHMDDANENFVIAMENLANMPRFGGY